MFARVDPPASPSPGGNWLERVSRLSLDLVTIFDAERLLERIIQAFAEIANVKKGSLMLPDKSGERLEIRASLGISDHARQVVKPRIGEGAAGRSAQTGKPVLISDTSLDKDFYVDFFKDDRRSRPKETLLCLPLVYRDEVLGVVSLDQKASGEPFRPEDVDLLKMICNFSAVALANLRLYQESITDGLTGLIAQKTFHIRLREEFARARRYRSFLSLLFLDLDHFKKFNDTHGHPLGDLALKYLAHVLRDSTRSIDVVGRCGGEEFGILLLETDLPSARYVAERIRSSVEKAPLVLNQKAYPLTVSIGLASFSPAEAVLTPEVLFQRADKALYEAKAAGRNQAVPWRETSSF